MGKLQGEKVHLGRKEKSTSGVFSSSFLNLIFVYFFVEFMRSSCCTSCIIWALSNVSLDGRTTFPFCTNCTFSKCPSQEFQSYLIALVFTFLSHHLITSYLLSLHFFPNAVCKTFISFKHSKSKVPENNVMIENAPNIQYLMQFNEIWYNTQILIILHNISFWYLILDPRASALCLSKLALTLKHTQTQQAIYLYI